MKLKIIIGICILFLLIPLAQAKTIAVKWDVNDFINSNFYVAYKLVNTYKQTLIDFDVIDVTFYNKVALIKFTNNKKSYWYFTRIENIKT